MPLNVPQLDDRSFDQLLLEAQRRIPSFTPEWTNFGIDSDPGITIVELFAFLTENLLYRANRIPERDRLKFLQLLGIPMQPAAAAGGIITMRNERGPLHALPLNRGVVVSAGNVDFLTLDGLNVLPIDALVYYKQSVPPTDPRYADFNTKYQAILVATLAAQADAAGTAAAATPATTQLAFYETVLMSAPTPSDPSPVLDLATDTMDGSVYIALLAPTNVNPDDVRPVIANQTLSIGVVPALSGGVPPLPAVQTGSQPTPSTGLIYEIPRVQPGAASAAQYVPLTLLTNPDVLNGVGVAQVQLPDVAGLQTWSFDDPLQEGTEDFPPRIDDEQVTQRLITWIRIRLPRSGTAPSSATVNGKPSARLTWVGINAARVRQSVPVFNELLGAGTGEPDQILTTANVPVIPSSISVVVQDLTTGSGGAWRLTDDLLTAGADEAVFTLDPEAGQIRFGDGLHGARPQQGWRILAGYEYGGGLQGNLGIGAISLTRDIRLQGGYTVQNPIPTSGGDQGESEAAAEKNIPLVLRHQDRLVTIQDFQDVTMRTSGVDVGRAEVLPLFLPGDPSQNPAPGVVTVMVVPLIDALRPWWPTPDRFFLQRVCDYLDPRRLVTTEIYVRGPEYVPVYLSVSVQVRAGSFADVVRTQVTDALRVYLAAIPPGGPDGGGWPLNKHLLARELEAVVDRVPGVDFVNSLEMGVGSPVSVPDQALTGLQLPMIAGLFVTDGTAQPLSSLFGPAQPSGPGIQVVPVPVTRSVC